MKKMVNLSHARTDFQREVMRRIALDKVCPFCEEHFLKYHTRPIIRRGRYWILTENFQPYEGTRHHLLAVARKHVTSFAELPAPAHAELFRLFGDECRRRKIKGGTVLMRFGDTEYTGGTVSHLHAQLVTGAMRGKGRERLLVGVAYKTTTSPERSQRRRP